MSTRGQCHSLTLDHIFFVKAIGKKYVKNRSGHMTSMATMPVYGKNLLGHEPDMVYLPLQGGV